jgi:hypothetical protein
MTHSNHQRRRNRTIRLEILESRTLLSTAGVVSRPGAAVAPLARVAQFSNIAGDPKFKGTMDGFATLSPNGLVFSTSGDLAHKSGKNPHGAFGNGSSFTGNATGAATKGKKTTYKPGKLEVDDASNNGLRASIEVIVEGTEFKVKGTIHSGVGKLSNAKNGGTIHGTGTINQATGAISIELTVEYST